MRDTRPDRTTRYVETTLGLLSYSELAPHLAERVARLEAAILAEEFAERPLDESLLAEFHSRVCADLTPDWAGKWRTVEVTVGLLTPPLSHRLPMLMRDYVLELQARWEEASADDIELTLEFLAYAEGGFLSIHPFRDFNGRTVRVFITELLRRLDLPRVELAPETESGRAGYFTALEAADRRDWQPLTAIWQHSGHIAGGRHTQQPHLAFVPLPSLSLSGKADGRVRRFALLGYAASNLAYDAVSLYRTLAASLDGEEIEPSLRLQVVDDMRRDKVWPIYTRASGVWVTATPLDIARGYKVPTHAPDGTTLSSNERHRRRHSEWSKLVCASLRDVRIPDDLVSSCQIQLTPSPMLAATERAERYRPKEERIPFLHARIEFSRPVRGPLLVGDRRYFGLGLFVPASEC